MIMLNLKNELNKEQYAAVTHLGSPLLVLAGAGSGKTRVLTYRTYWLIKEQAVSGKKIILLTFTNKAAEEMSRRVNHLLGETSDIGYAGTFHTFCAKILRRYGREIGISPGYVIYDSKDQESEIKTAIENLNLDPKKIKPRGILSVISRLKNDLIDPKEITMTNNLFNKQVVDIWREYQRLLAKHQALDFDDLLTSSVKILNIKSVRSSLGKEYDWILVDEYQDTNKAQFELTKLLTKDPNKFTAVGDASQAIYSFRGADYRNLNLLEKDFLNLEIIKLEKNYRSTQIILDAAFSIINNNNSHPILKLTSGEKRGEEVNYFEAGDEKDEANYVISCCCEEIKQGREVAILYRTNAQSRTFEENLIKRGVVYKLVGGMRFYDRAEIKDLTALLRVVVNPLDEISWKRIDKKGKRKKEKYKNWLDQERDELTKVGALESLDKIIEETEYLSRFDPKDKNDLARIENIKEFLAVASEEEDLLSLLQKIALVQADESVENKNSQGKPKITLMTIHSAKGLEFDSVFVVGLEEGLFPHSRSLLEKDDLEEERRLMYVAITRARSKLFLSLARNRLMFGGRQKNMPSRFLAEIPSHLLNKVDYSGLPRKIRFHDTSQVSSSKNDEGEVGRRIVQDWEIEIKKVDKRVVEALVVDDFNEIDSW